MWSRCERKGPGVRVYVEKTLEGREGGDEGLQVVAKLVFFGGDGVELKVT